MCVCVCVCVCAVQYSASTDAVCQQQCYHSTRWCSSLTEGDRTELIQKPAGWDGRGGGHETTGPDKQLQFSNEHIGDCGVGREPHHEGEGGRVWPHPQDPEVGHSLTGSIHEDRASQP